MTRAIGDQPLVWPPETSCASNSSTPGPAVGVYEPLSAVVADCQLAKDPPGVAGCAFMVAPTGSAVDHVTVNGVFCVPVAGTTRGTLIVPPVVSDATVEV